MILDARNLDPHNSLLKLRDILSSNRGCDPVDVNVLVSTSEAAQKVKAFATMSGFITEVEKKDHYYSAHIKGYSCCA